MHMYGSQTPRHSTVRHTMYYVTPIPTACCQYPRQIAANTHAYGLRPHRPKPVSALKHLQHTHRAYIYKNMLVSKSIIFPLNKETIKYKLRENDFSLYEYYIGCFFIIFEQVFPNSNNKKNEISF